MALPLSKKLALFGAGLLVASAGTDAGDAACPEPALDDDLPQLMNVQLLQSDLSVRRAKVRAAKKEAVAAGSQAAPGLQPEAEAASAATAAEHTEHRGLAMQSGASQDVAPAALEFEDDVSLLATTNNAARTAAGGSQDAAAERAEAKFPDSSPIAAAELRPLYKYLASMVETAMSAVLTRHVAMLRFWEQHVKLPLAPRQAPEVRQAMPAPTVSALEQPGGAGSAAQSSLLFPRLPPEGITVDWLRELRRDYLMVFVVQMGINAGITILVAFLYIVLYKTPPVRGKEEKPSSFSFGWSHGLCSWYEAPEICCCALLCPAVRWSETTSYVPSLSICGMTSFWVWLLFFLAITAAWGIALYPMTNVVWFVILPVVLASYRSQLRARFKVNAGSSAFMEDCLLYWCCLCCTLTQDARHVEEAIRLGLGGELVGEPVSENPTEA